MEGILALLSPEEGALERRELARCAAVLRQNGLTLAEADWAALRRGRADALRKTGRIELGGGILPKLAEIFASSPYLQKEECAQTLGELQELFYEMKNESGERLGDEELLWAMRRAFDGPAGGWTERLGDTLCPLCRAARLGERAEEEPEEGEDGNEG